MAEAVQRGLKRNPFVRAVSLNSHGVALLHINPKDEELMHVDTSTHTIHSDERTLFNLHTYTSGRCKAFVIQEPLPFTSPRVSCVIFVPNASCDEIAV